VRHDRRVDPVEWRARLELLVGEALSAESADVVRDALQEEIDRLAGTNAPAQLVVDVPVIGVVDCAAGWVAVQLRPSGPATVHVGRSIGAVVEHVREAGDLDVVAIGKRAGTPEARTSEVDAWVRTRPTVSVLAVTPAAAARRADLEAAGLVPPAWYAGSGFDEEDLLEACAAALTALRHAAGDPDGQASNWV